MEIVPDELRDTARERYFKGDPKYRWNWNDFHFYFINNDEEYASRFRFLSISIIDSMTVFVQ